MSVLYTLKSASLERFFHALDQLHTVEEYYRFFDDVCTVSELQAIAQRLEVAEMLAHDETYMHIAEKTGASTATISRVKKCLNYGADGYRIVLDRMNDKKGESSSETDA